MSSDTRLQSMRTEIRLITRYLAAENRNGRNVIHSGAKELEPMRSVPKAVGSRAVVVEQHRQTSWTRRPSTDFLRIQLQDTDILPVRLYICCLRFPDA